MIAVPHFPTLWIYSYVDLSFEVSGRLSCNLSFPDIDQPCERPTSGERATDSRVISVLAVPSKRRTCSQPNAQSHDDVLINENSGVTPFSSPCQK